jgi:hypothetical protein
MSKRISVLALAALVSLSASSAMMAAETKAKKTSSGAAKAKAEVAKAPRLTVVEPIKDFGTVPKGQKLDWNFMVKNSGNADLEIIAARPACGCTVSDFDKVVKPGQDGKVHASVDTTAFTGPIAKSVTVETNDPSTPTVQVTITAIVKPYVEASPAGFVRFNMLQGDAESQSVILYSEENEPFEIVKVETPQPWIKVDYAKIEDPTQVVQNAGRPGQAQYRFTITAGGPDAKLGPIAEKVKITTNSHHQPEYNLTVSGVVRPSFVVQPSGVNFGEVSPTESAATRTVTVKSNNLKAPESFIVTKAESSVPGVSADVKATANKGEYEVTLQVAKDAKPGDVTGDVKIFTSDKNRPEVIVPVKGTIKPVAK